MSFIAKYVARKLFNEHAQNAFGSEDPYFEEIPADELGRKKKGSKRRRGVPPGLSPNDAAVLAKVLRRAYRLDMSLGMCCCGFAVGWSGVIGLIPGVGDLICIFFAYMIITAADGIDGGLPPLLRARMLANVCIDFGLGLVPIVGDVVDILYKANSRNALLLENHLRERGRKNLAHGGGGGGWEEMTPVPPPVPARS
ncbi:uncharacterized protein V1518DRAFT_419849 [Limtongia smithiae]|uniref:uncharacterized protein n=1 Tax=Limtongia smithiae TaxID=1125753 RepID=UPI0034CF3FC9